MKNSTYILIFFCSVITIAAVNMLVKQEKKEANKIKSNMGLVVYNSVNAKILK